MHHEAIERAAELVARARRVVALTGAGYSKPSGIPDFRSPDGIWTVSDPSEVASLRAFRRDPDAFYSWLNGLLGPILVARPNPAHLALAELEHAGRLSAVITQNIDGLHQMAGSRRVYELHGHLRSATCLWCGRQVPVEPLLQTVRRGQAPHCSCGGHFKPDVVLFDEMLPQGVFWLAHRALEECDLLLVAGTSLEVAPVCDLPLVAHRRGAKIVIVNLDPTDLDAQADVVIPDDVATAVPALVRAAIGDPVAW
ncbi:MAG: NAD-dependent deacylase [Chloroflexales bacterium]|nr:NAD-dependent deacylase [Chloroflexales bacterium]